MNVVFENLPEKLNFVDCQDVVSSGIRRFTPSPMLSTMTKGKHKTFTHSHALRHYIIPTGVNHSPSDWASANSILDNLSPVYMKDLQSGKALLCIDQSLEGYQTGWLWDYFHRDCAKHGVDPTAIVYVTGNSLAPKQYKHWCNALNIERRIKVIAYEHFELDVQFMAENRKTPYTWMSQLKYKREHDIKTYNCLNKRLRPHRIWMYTELYKNNLLDKGLVSMNPYHISNIGIDGKNLDINLLKEASHHLPLDLYGNSNTEHPDNYYIRRILDQVYLDSWVSVVSEPQFAESEQSVFCSEKVFKSIASFHPFIIVGGQGILQRLRDLGYKTFDGWIDETYDTLPSTERFEAIADAIKKIDAIEDKLAWFASMKDVLTHNYNLFVNRKQPPAFLEMEQYYSEYFNV